MCLKGVEHLNQQRDDEQHNEGQDQDLEESPDQEQQLEIDEINSRRPTFPGAEPAADYSPANDGLDQQPVDAPLGVSSFTDDEVQNLREIFDLFDKEKSGHIEIKDLETIMSSLQRDPSEVREFVENIDPNAQGRISFEEFLDLMQQVENKIVKSGAPMGQQ